MDSHITCACGRTIRNTAGSIKQHEKTKVHKQGLETAETQRQQRQQRLLELRQQRLQREAAEEAAKEEQWVSKALENIAQTKRENKAATTIQWWWRKVSADPANHVGFRRMLKLFEEL
jgi:hypothetical protein